MALVTFTSHCGIIQNFGEWRNTLSNTGQPEESSNEFPTWHLYLKILLCYLVLDPNSSQFDLTATAFQCTWYICTHAHNRQSLKRLLPWLPSVSRHCALALGFPMPFWMPQFQLLCTYHPFFFPFSIDLIWPHVVSLLGNIFLLHH